MPAPGQFILNKQVIPSELRSREWEAARVDYWRMERAFVMAGKVRFEDAQACRNAAAALANGKVSLIEARRAVREELERAGYRPTPGTTGTIKDIYTPRRLDVTLKTNVNMARGYAEKNRLTGNAMYPASELHRNRQSREPRDWQMRWNEAAASVNYEGVARDGSFIALNDSPIWAALSRWRTPYPPFDYGSGMWWRPVKWSVAEKKGLVTDEDMERIESQRPESFNHDVALDANVRDEDLGAALAEQMKGIAEWDGSSLRLVDRNGTRPYDAGEIGRVITTQPREDVPASLRTNYQADALAEFLSNPDGFRSTAAENHAGLDMIEDVARLFGRILPDAAPELETSLTLTAQDMAALQSGVYRVPLTVAALPAVPVGSAPPASGNVRLVVQGGSSARRIDLAAAAIGRQVAPGSRVLLGGTAYRVTGIDTATRPATITVREL